MNPHKPHPTSLFSLFQSLVLNRNVIYQMSKREVVGRYRGSFMGLAWSFFYPVFMLLVYTFVFSIVFKAKWGIGSDESKSDFALVLFVGLIIHSLFAEAINQAPSVILNNVNYIKKVVYPVEILPVVAIFASLFHALISICVLLTAFLFLNGYVPWTIIWLPLILVPFLFFIMGFSWMLASLGVFIRDAGQAVGIITSAMMFLAPVFYPITALPAEYQKYLYANPLTTVIEQSRRIVLLGELPNWWHLFAYSIPAVLTAWLGYWWFQKTRKGFADVI